MLIPGNDRIFLPGPEPVVALRRSREGEPPHRLGTLLNLDQESAKEIPHGILSVGSRRYLQLEDLRLQSQAQKLCFAYGGAAGCPMDQLTGPVTGGEDLNTMGAHHHELVED